MKICLEIPDEMAKNLLKEAWVNTLSLDDMLLRKIAVPFRSLEKNANTKTKSIGVVGLASERKKEVNLNVGFEKAVAAQIPQSLIDDIINGRCVTIQHVYRLTQCVPPHQKFTLKQLIDCLPIKCTDLITENQERGWPCSFLKFMHDEMHMDYDSTEKPIVYWRTRN